MRDYRPQSRPRKKHPFNTRTLLQKSKQISISSLNCSWMTFYLLFTRNCLHTEMNFFLLFSSFNLNWKLSWLWRFQIWKSLFHFQLFILRKIFFHIIHFISECTWCKNAIAMRFFFFHAREFPSLSFGNYGVKMLLNSKVGLKGFINFLKRN